MRQWGYHENWLSQSLFGVEGKIAIVIGGTWVLCGAMAEGLAAAGAEIVLVGRNAEKEQANLEKIHAHHDRTCFGATDVSLKLELTAPMPSSHRLLLSVAKSSSKGGPG